MGFEDVLRGGVDIINSLTKTMQVQVQYRRYIPDNDGYGPDLAPAVLLDALVDWKQRQVRTQAGVLSVSRAMVMFVDITQLTEATGGEGIGDNDVIILPDGDTGPILDMSGFIDSATGRPFATEVYIG